MKTLKQLREETPAAETLEESVPKGHTIEAYGVRGMKGMPWRRTFKDYAHMAHYTDAGPYAGATVHGTRRLEHGEMHPETAAHVAKHGFPDDNTNEAVIDENWVQGCPVEGQWTGKHIQFKNGGVGKVTDEHTTHVMATVHEPTGVKSVPVLKQHVFSHNDGRYVSEELVSEDHPKSRKISYTDFGDWDKAARSVGAVHHIKHGTARQHLSLYNQNGGRVASFNHETGEGWVNHGHVDEELVSEMNKSTLASYIGKASKDAVEWTKGAAAERQDNEPEAAAKFDQKAAKRQAGIVQAARKLAKEEVVTEAKGDAFNLWAAENRKNKQNDRLHAKAKRLDAKIQKLHHVLILRHHNELIKTAHRAEARGSQAEWEDAIAAIAAHQRKHPHLNLPGHLGEGTITEARKGAGKSFKSLPRRGRTMTGEKADKVDTNPTMKLSTRMANSGQYKGPFT